MNWNRLSDHLQQPARAWQVLIAAIAILAGLHGLSRWIDSRRATNQTILQSLLPAQESSTQILDHYRSLRDLKARDVTQLKTGFSDQARFRKLLFEAGLSLQEERRLLEKQLEIMTTYLTIDPELQRIFLMRGEQPLESYRIAYLPPHVFPAADALPAGSTDPITPAPLPGFSLPSVARIVSKERFAHPERGHSEQIDGQLRYTPPQVGTSVRSNALGQYVMFTNSKLILHGPPLNEEDHEKFPHICLGLGLEAARKLYRGSFIGTKILLKNALAAADVPKR